MKQLIVLLIVMFITFSINAQITQRSYAASMNYYSQQINDLNKINTKTVNLKAVNKANIKFTKDTKNLIPTYKYISDLPTLTTGNNINVNIRRNNSTTIRTKQGRRIITQTYRY